MKTRRFFSLFFAALLAFTLFTVPASAYEGVPDPEILAKAVLLVDQKTGAVVYAKNEHQELYPASLTKVMTALLVLEAVDAGRLSLDQTITASTTALDGLDSDGSTAGIQVGEEMSVRNLLYCLLVHSANEAANILAEKVSGSVGAFVADMNAKAEELGCKNTHFMNPHGLHDSQHYASAWDLYLITTAALKYPSFMEFCDTASVTIPATNLSDERLLRNTNYLISGRSRDYLNTDAHGIKTGSHSQAGHCLISTIQRASLSFISVIMGTDRIQREDGIWWTYSFGETNRLYDWAFDNFTYQTVLEETDVAGEAEVSLSKTDRVTMRPAEEVEILLPRSLDLSELEQIITLDSDPVEAPIAEGDKLGTLSIQLDGEEYATVDLLAFTDVEASQLLVFLRDLKEFFSKTSVKIGCGAVLALAVLFTLWKLVFSKRRYRYGRSVSSGRNGYRGGRKRR